LNKIIDLNRSQSPFKPAIKILIKIMIKICSA